MPEQIGVPATVCEWELAILALLLLVEGKLRFGFAAAKTRG